MQGHGEDWAGLRQWLTANNTQWNAQLLDIVDGQARNNNARKENLRKLDGGNAYRFLLENAFPELRRTEYQFTYQVRSFNAAEAIERYKTNPRLLSLAELYQVGNSSPKVAPNVVACSTPHSVSSPTHP